VLLGLNYQRDVSREMDTVKSRLVTLESKVAALESNLQKVTGTTAPSSSIHAVFPSEEFLEYPFFEEMNTLKFLYKQKIDHGRTEKKYYEYSLVNPTETMLDIIGLGTVPRSTYPITLLSFCDSPEKVETYGYEVILTDWTTAQRISDERKVKKIREELDKYFFQVSDICTCNVRPSLFPSEILIRFRNEYAHLPHLSFYLTPFQESSHLTCSIQSLSTTSVTFKIVQRHTKGEPCILTQEAYSTPQDLMLHLHVRGIPVKTEEGDLLA
jgi:hypothetical protein